MFCSDGFEVERGPGELVCEFCWWWAVIGLFFVDAGCFSHFVPRFAQGCCPSQVVAQVGADQGVGADCFFSGIDCRHDLVRLCCDALVVAPLAPVNHVVFAGIAQFFPTLIDADVAGDAEQPADECGDFVPLGIFDLVSVQDRVVENGRRGAEAIDGLHELFIVYFVFDVVQAWSLIRFFKLNGAVGASDRGVLVGVPVDFVFVN